MGFKFIHAADIHLDSPLQGLEQYEGAPVAEIRGATRAAFVNLIQACLDQQVAFLLLAGDLFDGDWRDYNTGLFFLKQMDRLKEAGIQVCIVSGNHDAQNTMTRSLAPLSNMKVFDAKKPETFRMEELQVAIHGQSYGKQEAEEDLSQAYPAPEAGVFNIGLLHTSADGGGGEHETYAPCTVAGLIERGYDYWALGHIHRRQVLHADPLIVFPGNLQGRHIKEAGPKGATLVRVERGQARAEHVDLDVMRWHLLDVTTDAGSASSAIDQVQASLAGLRAGERRPLAVRVRLRGSCGAHSGFVSNPERWTNEVRARGSEFDAIWVEKVLFETRTAIDLRALRLQPSPLGELLRTVDALRADPSSLKQAASDLDTLREKIGAPDLGHGAPFQTEAELLSLLDDAEQLLIPLLMGEGGGE